jgi:thymidylate synthase
MLSKPFLPRSTNLSVAWAEVFLRLMDQGVQELPQVLVTVTDFAAGVPHENCAIRERLDQELVRQGKHDCHTVANTIFPMSLWNPQAEDNAQQLFNRYAKIWPRIKQCEGNRRGGYFRRLMAFCPKDSPTGSSINQLQHIIETYKRGNHRRTALLALLFDPTRDHTHGRQQGFPCLQRVEFIPLEGDGLWVTGSYTTQYLFERAYGNYLGLCHLGRFMAAQMGLSLVQMTCSVTVAQRGKPSKGCLQGLADELRQLVPTVETKA